MNKDRRNCQRRLLIALRDEMKERKYYHDWVERERQVITDAANLWARTHGLNTNGVDPITVDDVESIEHLAMGHSDYASKLALYVTELLYDGHTHF